MKVFEIGDSCISQIFGSPSGDYREIYEIDSRSETGNGAEDKKNLQRNLLFYVANPHFIDLSFARNGNHYVPT